MKRTIPGQPKMSVPNHSISTIHELSDGTKSLETESHVIERLRKHCRLDNQKRHQISHDAEQLISQVRKNTDYHDLLEEFLGEYSLNNDEGVLLMCLAESLLRLPDDNSRDALIREKLSAGRWRDHLGKSDAWLINASSYGLLLGKHLVKTRNHTHSALSIIEDFISRAGEELVFQGVYQAMGILASQFVLAESIQSALQRATPYLQQGYLFSFDMLGEAALTTGEALQYSASYERAIETIAKHDSSYIQTKTDVRKHNEISIKLSALHPRFEATRQEQLLDELLPRLKHLCLIAAQHHIPITIDAEEIHRLEPTMMLLEHLVQDKQLSNWQGLGVAVQAYQRHALSTLSNLLKLTRQHERKLAIRLVKGAYWDSEIKHAQQLGLDAYPVFTHKRHSDISWLACARFILDHPEAFYGQFATHNAHSLQAIQHMQTGQPYEMQKLYGMGDGLFRPFLHENKNTIPCRIYAPVGPYDQLLPYLVRRLLENGANASFLHHIFDRNMPSHKLAADPLTHTDNNLPTIPLPGELFMPERPNSFGHDLSRKSIRDAIDDALTQLHHQSFEATSLINGQTIFSENHQTVYSPANLKQHVGITHQCDTDSIAQALGHAEIAFDDWNQVPIDERAKALNRMAELLQENQILLLTLLIREAGRTITDGLNEIREAIDFCYYYAAQSEQFAAQKLAGITGEENQLLYSGRGIFICISPWNFPLAIFIGQIAAALVSGNSVIAKPASATQLIAWQVTRLFYEAGIPFNVLQLLLTSGNSLSKHCLTDPRIAGVAFTGSFETAKSINQTLAARESPITSLIAETGGINVMIVDATALLPQTIPDLVASAFNSAGQRCSACRVVFVQNKIADEFIVRLRGAMQELTIGDPLKFNTDIGPLINQDAIDKIQHHERDLNNQSNLLYRCHIETQAESFHYAPALYEISGLDTIKQETFGPVLHLVRYAHESLNEVLHQINASNFGLTLSIHSRLQSTIDIVTSQAQVGNIYINRNQIGAVVGSQPFGGEKLSGTGPKAGGPNYLQRFMTERTISNNTAAIGGNTELLR